MKWLYIILFVAALSWTFHRLRRSGRTQYKNREYHVYFTMTPKGKLIKHKVLK